MIEATVRNYLNNALDVPVYMEVPKDVTLPGEFVVVEKTGSGRTNYINTATIALQSYAGSLYSASLLNESVKAAMDNIIALDDICDSQLDSDYNFTDTTTKEHRYQAVYDVTHY